MPVDRLPETRARIEVEERGGRSRDVRARQVVGAADMGDAAHPPYPLHLPPGLTNPQTSYEPVHKGLGLGDQLKGSKGRHAPEANREEAPPEPGFYAPGEHDLSSKRVRVLIPAPQ